jgi:hypothetical protein
MPDQNGREREGASGPESESPRSKVTPRDVLDSILRRRAREIAEEPRVPLTFRVGGTGHRAIDPQNVAKLNLTLALILTTLRNVARKILEQSNDDDRDETIQGVPSRSFAAGVLRIPLMSVPNPTRLGGGEYRIGTRDALCITLSIRTMMYGKDTVPC